MEMAFSVQQNNSGPGAKTKHDTKRGMTTFFLQREKTPLFLLGALVWKVFPTSVEENRGDMITAWRLLLMIYDEGGSIRRNREKCFLDLFLAFTLS